MDIEIPEIDTEKLLKLRKRMLQMQTLAQRAQEDAWAAENEFNSYARWGDLLQRAESQTPCASVQQGRSYANIGGAMSNRAIDEAS